MKIKKLYLALSLSVVLSGSLTVFASAEMSQENRVVPNFTSIEVSGNNIVKFENSGNCSVLVSAKSDLIDHVKTEVQGSVLKVYEKGNVSHLMSITPKIIIKASKVSSISIHGNTRLDVSRLQQPFSVNTAGESKVILAGKSSKLTLQLSGNTEINASKLNLQDAFLTIYGEAKVKFGAIQSLNLKGFGKGVVLYKGNPKISRYLVGSVQLKKY